MPQNSEVDSSDQEFTLSTDDIERAGNAIRAELLLMIPVAKLIGLVDADIDRLKTLLNEIKVLQAKYTILKTNAEENYRKYAVKKQELVEDLSLDDETQSKKRLSKKQKQRIAKVIKIKLQAHEDAISSLAPGAVIESIKKNEEFITSEKERITNNELSSYLRVDVTHKKKDLKITATTERVADQIVDRLQSNPETNIVVVNAPPGSGKTTFMDDMETKFRIQGWGVVQINFDGVIGKFFEREGKETRTWSSLTAEEFDKSFFDLEKMVANYYPKAYQGKRIIVMIDTLGYNIDQMFYGLWLIGRLLKVAVNEGKALVLSIVPQPSVVQEAMKSRSDGDINLKNSKSAAEQLRKSKGAPAKAVERHDQELSKKVAQAELEEPAFSKLIKNIDMSLLDQHIPSTELQLMIHRLAYCILTKNDHEINENWWFIVNLFRKDKREELVFPTNSQ